MHTFRFLILITPLLIITGCATTQTGDKMAETNRSPAKAIYTKGKEALTDASYKDAIRHFKSLEILYPADPYTRQAQMELAYAYHKNGDPTLSIATAEKFISNYPNHTNVDYAYYLKGLTSFEQAIDTIDSEPALKSQQRPLMAQFSLQYFSELIDLFPNSKYNNDASQRAAFLRDKLAQYEVLMAKYHLDQGNYATAALHAKSTIENYPHSPAVPEAATITNQAYKLLGLQNPPTAASASDNKSFASSSPMDAIEQVLVDTAENMTTVIIPFKAPDTEATEMQETESTMTTTAEAHDDIKNDMQDQMEPDEPQTKTVKQPSQPMDAMIAPQDSIHREIWLLDQDPDNYTVQLLGTENEKALVKLINGLDTSHDAAYFQNSRNGFPWYSLIYGVFPSIAEANVAINELPDKLLQGQPWIRKMGAIHKAIEKQKGTE